MGGGSYKTIRFYLVGQRNFANKIAKDSKQIEQWHDTGIITYLGQTSDVREFIAQSSCVVLPSYREGVSVSLLESMSMAKPIITTNAPGCKEVIQDTINGFICEVKSVDSLKQALQRFIALDEQERAKMGIESRKIASSTYDVHRIIAHYQATRKS